MTIQQDNSRYANPTAAADLDAFPQPVNPLATGKKDDVPGALQEWGSLRFGVPKEAVAFNLPSQVNPFAK